MNMTVEDIKTELIKIEYADNDLLYIPVTSIDLLRKFTTHSKHKAPLHSLGSTKWEKTKKRAKNKINDIKSMIGMKSLNNTYEINDMTWVIRAI